MTENLLKQFLAKRTFDIRAIGDGTWIDQKCTPDEIRFVAECIIAYVDETGEQTFRSPDVWHSKFATEQVQIYFGKPDPFSKEAIDEYNKFYRQPMKMFALAGILKIEFKKLNAFHFSVANRDVLEFVARNDWNAYLFLTHYAERVLRDSGIWDPFETFFEEQTEDSFKYLRDAFIKFQIKNTPKNGETEIRRILPKVLNVLACRYGKRGAVKGHISKLKISFPYLRYNQENWRDTGKPKDVTRQEFAGGKKPLVMSESYQIQKAKKEVKAYNDTYCASASEVVGLHHAGKAIHMHHIFMASQFPVIADFPENIIALTPGQHLGMAHPNGDTSKIDPGYQYQCLLSKSVTIEKNVLGHCGPAGFYDFDKFVFVLGTGLTTPVFDDIPTNDFTELRNQIDAKCG